MTMRYGGRVRTAGKVLHSYSSMAMFYTVYVCCTNLLVKVDGCGLPRLRLIESADLLDAVKRNPHTNLHMWHNYITPYDLKLMLYL